MEPVLNLYVAGPPVQGAQFVGRDDILSEIVAALQTHTVLLLQGQRRIGKTSLLHRVYEHLCDPQFGGRFLSIECDMQELVGRSTVRFVQELVNKLNLVAAERVAGWEGPIAWDGELATFFSAWLPGYTRRIDGHQLVIIFDEFDNLSDGMVDGNAREIVLFLNQLVRRHQQIKWILAIGRQVGRLPIEFDAIVGAALQLPIGRLTRPETVRLIQALAGGISYSPEAIELIWQLTNGQPLLIQALCREAFELALDNEQTSIEHATVSQVTQRVFEQYEPAIASIARVPPLEGRVLIAVARLSGIDRAVSRAAVGALLVEYSISIQTDELDDALRQLTRWDLLEQLDGYRVPIELVRMWLAGQELRLTRNEQIDLASVRAAGRIELAEQAMRAGQVQVAIEEYREALTFTPQNPKIFRGLADAYRQTNELKQYAEMLRELQRQRVDVMGELLEALEAQALAASAAHAYGLAADLYGEMLRRRSNPEWGEKFAQANLLVVEGSLESFEQLGVSADRLNPQLTPEFVRRLLSGHREQLSQVLLRVPHTAQLERIEQVRERLNAWQTTFDKLYAVMVSASVTPEVELYGQLLDLLDRPLWRQNLIKHCAALAGEVINGRAQAYTPRSRAAQRGLADAYRLHGASEHYLATLRLLYHDDKSVEPELIEALEEYARIAESHGEHARASDLYEELLSLQDRTEWYEPYTRARAQEADHVLAPFDQLGVTVAHAKVEPAQAHEALDELKSRIERTLLQLGFAKLQGQGEQAPLRIGYIERPALPEFDQSNAGISLGARLQSANDRVQFWRARYVRVWELTTGKLYSDAVDGYASLPVLIGDDPLRQYTGLLELADRPLWRAGLVAATNAEVVPLLRNLNRMLVAETEKKAPSPQASSTKPGSPAQRPTTAAARPIWKTSIMDIDELITRTDTCLVLLKQAEPWATAQERAALDEHQKTLLEHRAFLKDIRPVRHFGEEEQWYEAAQYGQRLLKTYSLANDEQTLVREYFEKAIQQPPRTALGPLQYRWLQIWLGAMLGTVAVLPATQYLNGAGLNAALFQAPLIALCIGVVHSLSFLRPAQLLAWYLVLGALIGLLAAWLAGPGLLTLPPTTWFQFLVISITIPALLSLGPGLTMGSGFTIFMTITFTGIVTAIMSVIGLALWAVIGLVLPGWPAFLVAMSLSWLGFAFIAASTESTSAILFGERSDLLEQAGRRFWKK